MKKILLISDTHGYIDEKIIKYASQVDEIWHAGDIGDISVSDKLKKIKPLRTTAVTLNKHTVDSRTATQY